MYAGSHGAADNKPGCTATGDGYILALATLSVKQPISGLSG
jgi:hypothetical protein